MEDETQYLEIDNIQVAHWAFTSIKQVREEMREKGTDKEEKYLFFGFHEFYVDSNGKITQLT